MLTSPPETSPKTSPETSPKTPPKQAFLHSENPTDIATYIQTRRTQETSHYHCSYSINKFIAESSYLDMNNPSQIRATLETQANLLNRTFQYMLLSGNPGDYLPLALKAQVQTIHTLQAMDKFASLDPDKNKTKETKEREEIKHDKNLDA